MRGGRTGTHKTCVSPRDQIVDPRPEDVAAHQTPIKGLFLAMIPLARRGDGIEPPLQFGKE